MLSVAATILLPLVSATSIFNVTYPNTGYTVDDKNVHRSSVEFEVRDPATGNKTSCLTTWYQRAAPATWTNCNSPTFSFKLDQWQELNIVAVEIKHQYIGKGKICTQFNDKGCVTSRAYGVFNTNTERYSSACSAEIDKCGSTWNGFYVLPVFSSCKGGCGINSGAN